MILYPAIDIRDGQAVRLAQGDFAQETVYDADPLDAARAWVEAGARWLHVVDLDGARDGTPANLEHVERICGELGVPVQFGGGLRSLESIAAALAAGAERVILGTAAYTDVDFLDDAIAAHGDRVIVSVDVRGGRVASAGWTRPDGDAGGGRDRAPAAARGAAVRLLEHRARRDADRGRPRGGEPRRRGRARARSSTPAGSARSRT